MDAIFEGAEFTIVAAAGDASSGLPGVMKKSQKLQPLIELKKPIGLPVSSYQMILSSPPRIRMSYFLALRENSMRRRAKIGNDWISIASGSRPRLC